MLRAQLRLVQLERRVGVDDAELRATAARSASAYSASCSSSGPRIAKSMSRLPPPMLNVCRLRTPTRRSRVLPHARADLLHHVALRVVAAERRQRIERHDALEPAASARRCAPRAARSATNTCASLTVLNGPPAIVVSTVRIAGHLLAARASIAAHRVVHRGEAGAFRRGDAHLELRFVHAGRQELLPHQPVERDHRQHHEHGDDRDDQRGGAAPSSSTRV